MRALRLEGLNAGTDVLGYLVLLGVVAGLRGLAAEKTPDLAAFYPTQLLVTGFDILFFWVAR